MFSSLLSTYLQPLDHQCLLVQGRVGVEVLQRRSKVPPRFLLSRHHQSPCQGDLVGGLFLQGFLAIHGDRLCWLNSEYTVIVTVLTQQNSWQKAVWISDDSPGKLCKESDVEALYIFEAKTSPPLGKVILSQATQLIFLFPSLESHQKRVITDCIFLHKLTGSWKHDIGKVGIAARTAFRSVSLPAVDRHLEDQETAHWCILSTMETKRSLFLRLKCSGKPKYLPTPPSLSIFSSCFTLALASAPVFDENVSEDFNVLIFCPDAVS